jgi:PPM family protein phosphatase
MKFLSLGITDQGRVRSNNEDAFIDMPEIGLFAVADGMGGEQCGEVASALAVKTVSEFISDSKAVIEAYLMSESSDNRAQVLNMLSEALISANTKVYRKADELKLNGRMGTTLTIFLALEDTGFMVHAGDSRLYMVRDGELTQLSTDHTVANDYRKQYGDEGAKFDERISGMLTRAVGIQEFIEPEKLSFLIAPNDRYLLCSDGLYNYMGEKGEEVLLKMLASNEYKPEDEDKFLSSTLNLFIENAYKNGGGDNITALLITIFGSSSEEVTETKEIIKRFDAVRSIALFEELEYKDVLSVMDKAEIRTYNRYDVINRIAVSDPELYIILEGKVSSLKGSKHIKTFYTGDHIGEVAFLTGETPQFNLFVDKPSTFLVIKKSEFKNLVLENPVLGAKLLWQLSAILARQTNSSIALIKDK